MLHCFHLIFLAPDGELSPPVDEFSTKMGNLAKSHPHIL
jgi:hypothetical protein